MATVQRSLCPRVEAARAGLAADRTGAVGRAPANRPQNKFGKGEVRFAGCEGQFDLSRDRFVFTGDSPNDAQIARAAGVPFRAPIAKAFQPADFLAVSPHIRILNDLSELVESLECP